MTYKPTLLEKLERRLSRYAVRNLMLYIVAGMSIVYLMDMFVYPVTGFNLSSWLMFDRAAILRGQIWRLVSFVLIPPSTSLLFVFFSLYFNYIIGSALEGRWGRFRLNLYYACGMLGAVLSGLLTGYSTNYYLNLSLFFAFAILYPDYELILIVLPVKIKYLALLDALLILYSMVMDTWSGRLALVFSMINLILFFSRDVISTVKNAYRRYQWKKNWRR